MAAYGTPPEYRPIDPFGVALMLLASVPIAIRSRFPVPVLIVTGTTTVVLSAFHYNDAAGLGALFALYTVAAHSDRQDVAPGAPCNGHRRRCDDPAPERPARSPPGQFLRRELRRVRHGLADRRQHPRSPRAACPARGARPDARARTRRDARLAVADERRGSPASCTTSSPTTSASSWSRPRGAARPRNGPRGARRASERRGRRAARHSPRCAGCSASCAHPADGDGHSPHPACDRLDGCRAGPGAGLQVELRSRANRGSCRQAVDCPPTGSSRRRSRTRWSTQGRHARRRAPLRPGRLDLEVTDDGRGPASVHPRRPATAATD